MTQDHTITGVNSVTRPATTKTLNGLKLIYQPTNIALQYPFSSHNRRCMQRPESWGLHNSIDILLPRSRWNQTNRLSNKIQESRKA